MMFELETTHLRLIPLPLEYLRLLVKDRRELERRLGLQISADRPNILVQAMLENEILPAVLADPGAYEWHTEWQIALKSENRIIGGFCFKGQPDEQGEIEIGYGMHPDYRNRGFMTEAVGAAIDWALTQEGVKAVRAETELTNIPSIRVLEKAGLEPAGHSSPAIAPAHLIWRTRLPKRKT